MIHDGDQSALAMLIVIVYSTNNYILSISGTSHCPIWRLLSDHGLYGSPHGSPAQNR